MNIIPGFPWPPPLFDELREIFRLPPKPEVPAESPAESPKPPEDA